MFHFPKLYYISTTAIVASANNSMVLLMSKMGEKRKVIYLTVAAPLRCFNRNPIQETTLKLQFIPMVYKWINHICSK